MDKSQFKIAVLLFGVLINTFAQVPISYITPHYASTKTFTGNS